MRALASSTAVLFLLTSLSGCAGEDRNPCKGLLIDDIELSSSNHTAVAFGTSKGCFAVELYDDKSPITVANFKTYVDEEFYAGTVFHRIVRGQIWVVQGGGMTEDGNQKTPNHPPIKNEAKTSKLLNEAYTLSMARTQAPDSATNQFFINTRNNTGLDPGGFSPDGYAVFGIVVHGREVVDEIQNAPFQDSCQTDCPPRDKIAIYNVRVM